MEKKAKIGLLRWEKGHVPMGLMQLEGLKGNSTNPESYPFEVDMRHVEGACTETIITHPSQEVCDRFIEIGKEMQAEGVKAITGSCGFNAIFQKQVSEALDIPVFLSDHSTFKESSGNDCIRFKPYSRAFWLLRSG